MQDIANTELPASKRTPWNKGKLTGAKPTAKDHDHIAKYRRAIKMIEAKS